MHHSDFQAIDILNQTAMEREAENDWIRRYNTRDHFRKARLERKKDSVKEFFSFIALILIIPVMSWLIAFIKSL